MQAGQNPAGPTTHNIYGRNSADQWFFFGSISQYTSDYDWLTLDISDRNRVRYIVIQTTSSPSWVAWREIKAYKPYPEIRGNIESASLQSVAGWACEFREEAPKAIHIYRNARVYLGAGNYREENIYLGGGTTGIGREQAVQNSCETSSANFGFNIPLTIPSNLLDGKSYRIDAHLIYADGSNAIVPGSKMVVFGATSDPTNPTSPTNPSEPVSAPYFVGFSVRLPSGQAPSSLPVTTNWPCLTICSQSQESKDISFPPDAFGN